MNFYIASSFKNIHEVRELARILKLEGWNHTYDWTKNERVDSYNLLSEIGKIEKQAVVESDFFVVLLPAGKGSHIEMGIALGLEKRVFLYSTTNSSFDFDQTSTFYHVDGVERFTRDLQSFAHYLIGKHHH
ncbi:group-specific protein [Bacillus sp. N3536]|nr:group-specific protein [Bacillus sp. N3536]